MTLKEDTVVGINSGDFSPEILECIAIDYAKTFKKEILQKFYREKIGNSEKRFTEYLLVENVKAILRMNPVAFYTFLRHCDELREVLNLKHLTTYKKYRNYYRKRKSLKNDFKKVLKRSFMRRVGEVYIIDTCVVECDLSKIRRGKKIKDGLYDAKFLHSSTKGTVVGFTVCVLMRWPTFSVVKVEFYPNNASKTAMWKKMVIETLGSKIGKIKMVIADAGFFAYENYTTSVHHGVIPVIKSRKDLQDKVFKKLNSLPTLLLWWNKRYSRIRNTLIKDLNYMVKATIAGIKNYKYLKKIRYEIELLFKTAKHVFGMENLHIYSTDAAYWKVYLHLYLASLFLQYLKIRGIDIHHAIELFQQKGGLT